MKVIKILLKILLVTIFILSITLNICVFLSSTNKLLIRDNSNSRLRLHNSLSLEAAYATRFTLTYTETSTLVDPMDSTKIYTEVESNKYYCTYSLESNLYSCSKVSTLHKNGELAETVYYPGDNFKYTENNSLKSKTAFSNDDMITSFLDKKELILTEYLDLLKFDIGSNPLHNVTVKTTPSIDLKKFYIDKHIQIKHKDKTCLYQIGKQDHLKNLTCTITSGNSKTSQYTLNFDENKIEFPSFEGYVG